MNKTITYRITAYFESYSKRKGSHIKRIVQERGIPSLEEARDKIFGYHTDLRYEETSSNEFTFYDFTGVVPRHKRYKIFKDTKY